MFRQTTRQWGWKEWNGQFSRSRRLVALWEVMVTRHEFLIKTSCMSGFQQVNQNSFLKHTCTNSIRDIVSRQSMSIFHALMTLLFVCSCVLYIKLFWTLILHLLQPSPLIQYCSLVDWIHTCMNHACFRFSRWCHFRWRSRNTKQNKASSFLHAWFCHC